MKLLRTLLSTTTIAGLATTASLAGMPAANAVALGSATGSLTGFGYGGGGCSVFSGTDPDPAGGTFSAGDSTSWSQTLNETYAAPTDATDTVALHGKQRVAVTSTVSGGQVRTMKVTSTVSGSATAAKGAASTCKDPATDSGTGWNLLGEVKGDLHRSTAGWVHLSTRTAGTGAQEAAVSLEGDTSGTTGGLAQTELGGGFAVRPTAGDQWVYVTAGDYKLDVKTAGATATYPNFPIDAVTDTVTLTFYPAGVAAGTESGTAKPMATLPGGLTCSTGKASVVLTSKVVGASNATIYVNGAKKASVTNPKTKTVAVAVPKNQNVTLKAVVKKAGKTYAATRGYRSC